MIGRGLWIALALVVAGPASAAELRDAEQTVVRYVADRIVEDGAVEFTAEEVFRATGVAAEDVRFAVVQPAVLAELRRRGFDVERILGSCSKHSACTLDGSLSRATREDLARFREAQAEDGAVYADRAAPELELLTVAGERVALADYRGRPVALFFMSADCYHCRDTLAMLGPLREKHAAQGLEIVVVLANGRLGAEVAPGVPLLVAEDRSVFERYESWIVPTTFLIDARGRIAKKLVGFKVEPVLDAALGALLERGQ